MPVISRIVNSGIKIFPDSNIETLEKAVPANATLFTNEPYSFQLAYKADCKIPIYYEISGNYPIDLVSVFAVGNVPVLNVHSDNPDSAVEDRGAGLYPDILFRKKAVSNMVDDGFWSPRYFEEGERVLLTALPGAWQALWFTLNEQGVVPAGNYTVVIKLRHQGNKAELSCNEFNIRVMDAELPKQTAYYTNWFHYDCLSDIYGVPVFSDRHFEIIAAQLKNASLYGMNTVLLPAFTPELDTPVGKERKTVQLVKIKRLNGEYEFDFSLLKRFIRLAVDCGIEHFEHCHFFSQWGAKHAPKIIAETENGEERIFGWETDSSSNEYSEFLVSYLTALKQLIKEEELEKRIFFHLSDEPINEKHLEGYQKAADNIREVMSGLSVKDTFSQYGLYRQTYVDTPIVPINDLKPFLLKCDDLWVYYTGESALGNYTNRFITHPNGRCRALGVQMYYHNISGFLHWAYNYYYSVLSHGLFDPAKNPCGYEGHPGTSYLAYPDLDGTPIPSVREKLMMEAFCDLRALKFLESKIGRDAVLKLCDDWFGDNILQLDYDKCYSVVDFREAVNRKILETL